MPKVSRGKSVWPAPVYVARFRGGEVCRMSFYSLAGKPLDFDRGRRICCGVIGNERAWAAAHPPKSDAELAPEREKAGRFAHAVRPYHMPVQGDPRGCALYVLRPGDVPDGADPSAYYSRGIAIYRE